MESKKVRYGVFLRVYGFSGKWGRIILGIYSGSSMSKWRTGKEVVKPRGGAAEPDLVYKPEGLELNLWRYQKSEFAASFCPFLSYSLK